MSLIYLFQFQSKKTFFFKFISPSLNWKERKQWIWRKTNSFKFLFPSPLFPSTSLSLNQTDHPPSQWKAMLVFQLYDKITATHIINTATSTTHESEKLTSEFQEESLFLQKQHTPDPNHHQLTRHQPWNFLWKLKIPFKLVIIFFGNCSTTPFQ